MKFDKNKLPLFFLFFFILTGAIRGQGKINVPAVECLGNTTSFSYTSPSGLTLSSATWYFGDGGTSVNISPFYTYANKGIYTIKIDAVFSNSTTRTDSLKIEVVGLPTSFFYLMPKGDTCLSRNKVCYKDTSLLAASGQTITNRLFVWGDGTFNNSFTPVRGDVLCHSYSVAAQYTLKMEVTDKFGCKSSKLLNLEIKEDIAADAVVDTSFIDCSTAQICVKNTSTGTNPGSGSYKWLIDTSAIDTNSYLNNKKCVTYKKERSGNVMLTVALNGCLDTFRQAFYNRLDSLPTKLFLTDSIWCWGDPGLVGASVNKTANCDKCNWRLNYSFPLPGYPHFYNPPPPFIKYLKSDEGLFFSPKESFVPGNADVALVIYRGSATCIVSDSFRINGPIANVKVFDNNQCFSNRQVFLTDESKYVKRDNCIFKWVLEDSNGSNCINNRAKGINLNQNCNESVDWYTKHKYKFAKTLNPFTFYIKDTITGCEQTIQGNVNLKSCGPILTKDSVNVCQGDIFLNIAPIQPKFVTLDTGKKWLKFPVIMDSTYHGVYDVGMIFETLESPWAENYGKDSIKIHKDTAYYYDTVYRKKFLTVNVPKQDTITMKVLSGCKPFRVSVYFKNGNFKKGEKLEVNWTDGGFYQKTFDTITHIDSLTHYYTKGGVQSLIRITITSEKGCEWRQSYSLELGKVFSSFNPKSACIRQSICFTPFIYDFKTQNYWNGNSLNRKVKWLFSDTGGQVNLFAPCHSFVKGGKQSYQMFITDSFGCIDTLRDTIFIQEVKANVRHTSRMVYCSELKQFFDSSFYIKFPGDSIKKYSWQFGAGVYSSFVKNPLQVINTALDKVHVLHAVEMVSGCTDTIEFDLDVVGPKPYFNIKDSIGCGSLLAVFKNLSKNCKSYNWEYGDQAMSNHQTNSLQDVSFNYTKPGRYYIYLTGLDTVYNPITGKIYYCKNTFPDKIFQKDTFRSVLVLPHGATGIVSADTICLGTSLNLKSLSDTGYNYDIWEMGDNINTYTQADGSTITHLFSKEGLYKVKLKPGYTNALNNTCRDSALKNIVVIGVNADFDVDPVTIPPLFRFYNKSNPLGVPLKWDFGQPSTGIKNNSTDQDPTHDYGNDTGNYTVCLIATLPYGCSDTVCKTIFNDHLSEFQLFNVFTPGNIDGKNDQYDILIEGENLYDLQIFNRWGNLVFSGDKDGDITNQHNWNGKLLNKGEDCPSGTYYYIFRYSLRNDPENVKMVSGVITLIR